MIIVAGKSCSGKTTIAEELKKLGYSAIVGYTTRPPRAGEIDGVAYHFVTEEEFLKKVDEGFFAETRAFHVACGEDWYYGTAKEDLGEDKVAVLNPDGVRALRKIPEINPVVFLVSADDETLRDRMEKRCLDMAEGKRRLICDREDFLGIEKLVDYVVHSDIGIPPEQIARTISKLYKGTVRAKGMAG